MNKSIIVVKDIVTGTSTNSEAVALFNAMDKAVTDGNLVVLSLKDCTPLSSSFLNSSLGAIVDRYSFDILKGKLSITDYTPVMAKTIKDYIDTIKALSHA